MRVTNALTYGKANFRPLVVALTLVLIVFVVGTIGYTFIEGWPLFDSFYMTVITLTTVGYREVHPLSSRGILFTIFLLLSGVGTFFYCFTLVTRVVVEGELKKFRTYYRMAKKISTFRNHTIVCGYGRLARLVVPDLLAAGQEVVAVENNPVAVSDLETSEVPFVEGNAYEDETLKAAGIERARNLLAFLPSDADNVYIALSARDLNPSLNIIARSEGGSGENKLWRAGADQVLAPYRVSASRVVQQLIRPNVSNFLEIATGKNKAELVVEEVRVPEDSPLCGKTLEDSDLRAKTGVIIAAVINQSGQMNFNPGRESLIEPRSTMIVLGKPGSVEKLTDLLLNHV